MGVIESTGKHIRFRQKKTVNLHHLVYMCSKVLRKSLGMRRNNLFSFYSHHIQTIKHISSPSFPLLDYVAVRLIVRHFPNCIPLLPHRLFLLLLLDGKGLGFVLILLKREREVISIYFASHSRISCSFFSSPSVTLVLPLLLHFLPRSLLLLPLIASSL